MNAMGITQYAQIAGLSEEDTAKVDEALTLKGRFARDDWACLKLNVAGRRRTGLMPA